LARNSGILLHITSLPGRCGIGDLGNETYRFVDFLKETGQHFWQILPLGPTGYGNSPYQSLSVFAGNPLFISLEKLVVDGLLEMADLKDAPEFPVNKVNYEAVLRFKSPLLKKSFWIFENKASAADKEKFAGFCKDNAAWLDNFALFVALKESHESAAWNTWPAEIRQREPEAVKRYQQKLTAEVSLCKYKQYQFFKQWSELKKYCNESDIRIIGDMPIFVALDSAEVWSQQGMFNIEEDGQPIVVAGVPPDYFSTSGQLWGNPLYRWEELKTDNYRWWVERFRAIHSMVDVIRLDHFRGFEKYWAIPAGEKTAANGQWLPGPGIEFFEVIKREFGELPIIAEDLGIITPEVEALRDRLGLPGMRVLQFAFSGDPKMNIHLPHLHIPKCVVYTGTHDNTTTSGWFRSEDIGETTQTPAERTLETQQALKYLGSDGYEINWDFIRLALMSVADTAIIPLQDILGLGNEARMNTPSVNSGNWVWRFKANMLTEDIRSRLKELTYICGR
jgi:4-alpha-glucanotransferase